MSGFPNPSQGTVVLAPSSSAMNVVQAASAAVVPFTVKGAAGQSADLQQWQDSVGTKLASIESTGLIRAFLYSPLFGSELVITSSDATSKIRVSNTGIGFYGVATVAKAAAIASPASDISGTKAAIDAIRVALTNLGLTA